jgi:predicted DNA-binding transcriptional regulator AlpA
MSVSPHYHVNASEVRKRFGNICRKTLYRWVRDPGTKFPAPIRVGRRCLWSDAELRAFIAAKKAEPKQ